MKACLLREQRPIGDKPLEHVDVEEPIPGPGEVLIGVRACGICRTDLHVVEGDLAPRRMPLIPGHQIVGEVLRLGPGLSADDVEGVEVGARVGVAWLHQTCGTCRFCTAGKENLCDTAEFTGWTRDGGFAEKAVAPAAFVYPLPWALRDEQAAPLLCAGIIGYRCLRQCGIEEWSGAKLGLYGFGAAAHIAIQIARKRGAEVYVCTRDRERHQALAEELGARWVGSAVERPPEKLDASIVFAPAGEIVPAALADLEKGGTLVLGGIHMTPIPPIDYELLYGERIVRTVANNTRYDGRSFLAEAARVHVRTRTETFPLADANEALIALKHDAIRGAGVLLV
jgi:propanol-preferring alcohol dehydrogenase